MVTVLHGNNLEASRNIFFEKKNSVKNPIFLNGEKLLFDDFFQAAENKRLFDSDVTLLVENFFAKNKPNTSDYKKIVEYINSNKNIEIIFWENKEIPKATLLKLKNAFVNVFSYPQNLFTFLDNIKPENYKILINLFHELEKTMEPELIFFMLIRQFRLLLTLGGTSGKQIDEVNRMAPWQVSKLKRQQSLFSQNKIVRLYNSLYEIELGQKIGKFPYDLEKSIDFFILDL